jgi:hypothetical protein
LLAKLIAGTAARSEAKPRTVVFFSNGSFDGIIARYGQAVKG